MPEWVCVFQRSVSWNDSYSVFFVGFQQGRFYGFIEAERDEAICECVILSRKRMKIKAGPVELIDFVYDNP